MRAIINHLFILLVGDHFNPLGMVRSLGEEHINPIVVLVGEDSYLVQSSKYIRRLHKVHSAQEGLELIIKEYSKSSYKPFILTGSDDIIAVIDRNYDRLCRDFFFFNAGGQGRVNKLLSKKEQNNLAKQCGFNVPAYEEVNLGDYPKEVTYPLITKAVDSTINNWKSQVYICRNEDELLEAYSHLKSEKILLQQYIEKKNETGFDAFSINEGRDTYLPLQLTYFTTTETSFGNAIYFFEPHDKELLEKINRIMMMTKFSGIFSIDFLEGKDGRLYFLEINFRNSAWSYPSTKAGVNLLVLWAESTLMQSLKISDVIIKKLPFSAIVEIPEFLSGLKKGIGSAVKTYKLIHNSDCLVFWKKNDNKPFWKEVFHTVGYLIKRMIHRLCFFRILL